MAYKFIHETSSMLLKKADKRKLQKKLQEEINELIRIRSEFDCNDTHYTKNYELINQRILELNTEIFSYGQP